MRDSRLKRELLKKWDAFSVFRRRLVLITKYRPQIMGTKKTIKHIKLHNCSIARFGDGEFELMLYTGDVGYQNRSPELAEALKRVLSNRSPDLLICIPRSINSTRGFTKKAKKYWRTWAGTNQIKVVNVLRDGAGKKYCFGDSLLSRPYMDYISPKHAQSVFPLLKELWENRDLLIVEGEKTRLGVGNDLFSNSRSIRRIVAPATDAFNSYSEIIGGILSSWNGELVLLALGPTATVLASDLSKKGIQTLDIGHLDIEYEWHRIGAKKKIAIPGKYVNEAKDGAAVTNCEERTYLDQIVLRIGS